MNNQQTGQQTGGFELRPLTTNQLSELYGISAKTLLRWLKPFAGDIGKKLGRYYNITQVRCILIKLGVPGSIVTGFEA